MTRKPLAVMALLLLSLATLAASAAAADLPYRIQLLEKSWTPAAGGTAAERQGLAIPGPARG